MLHSFNNAIVSWGDPYNFEAWDKILAVTYYNLLLIWFRNCHITKYYYIFCCSNPRGIQKGDLLKKEPQIRSSGFKSWLDCYLSPCIVISNLWILLSSFKMREDSNTICMRYFKHQLENLPTYIHFMNG